MPKWSEYLSAARERGSLALELYCVMSVPEGDAELLKATLPDHLAYQARLEGQGSLAFAGPLSDETGEMMEGMGMIVYRAPSFDAAKALADDDPMHARGARRYTLRRWMINEGGFALNVRLSGQSVSLA